MTPNLKKIGKTLKWRCQRRFANFFEVSIWSFDVSHQSFILSFEVSDQNFKIRACLNRFDYKACSNDDVCSIRLFCTICWNKRDNSRMSNFKWSCVQLIASCGRAFILCSFSTIEYQTGTEISVPWTEQLSTFKGISFTMARLANRKVLCVDQYRCLEWHVQHHVVADSALGCDIPTENSVFENI